MPLPIAFFANQVLTLINFVTQFITNHPSIGSLCSAYAPGSRWDVSFEYEAAALDGSDDEDGSEDGAE